MESSVKHGLFIFVLLLWKFLDSGLQEVPQEKNNSTICNTTNNSSAMLSCSSDSWYHVIQELYSPVNNNCSVNISNNNLQNNSDTGLGVSCAGPASPSNSSVCRESVKTGVKDYKETSVAVTYECINESKMYKLCLKQEVKLEGQVYLASPLMFASPEKSSFNSCVCEITGASKAEVLYANVDNSNVNITCGSWSRTEFLFIDTVVNIDLGLQDKPCTMKIIYRGDNRSGSSLTGRVWMKVSGSNMTLNCSEQPPDSVFTLSTTTTGTMSATTSSSTKTSLTTSFTSQESSPDSTVISSRCLPSSMSSSSSCTSLPMSNNSTTSQPVSSSLSPTLSTSQFLSSTSQPDSTTSQPVNTTSQPVTTTSQPVTTTSQPVSNTSQPVSTTSQPVSTTSQPVSTTSQPVSNTSQPVSTRSKPVSTTSQPVSTTSQPVSTRSKPVSTTSQPVSTTSQPVSTRSKPVSTATQPVSTTTKPVSITSKPVSTSTQSTSSTSLDTSAISQSAWTAPIYLIVPVVVGGVALIAIVVAILTVRTKCCQTRAKTRDRENCGRLGKEVPAPEDKDNRLSTHSCDVYVDLDDVNTTTLPDSPALCPATIQNGVRGPGGCDIIMFDNVAYVSGNDVTSNPDVTLGDDRDSDEVLMVDNDVYEPSSPVRTFKTFQNESTGDVSKDDVIMVDNVVYSSFPSTSPADTHR